MQKCKEFSNFMKKNPNVSEYENNKAQYKTKGMAALKELALSMGYDQSQFEVSFNKAGPAVSGDLHLKIMHEDGVGVTLFMSNIFNRHSFVIRTIKSFNDHTGGSNHNHPANLFDLPESIASKMKILMKQTVQA